MLILNTRILKSKFNRNFHSTKYKWHEGIHDKLRIIKSNGFEIKFHPLPSIVYPERFNINNSTYAIPVNNWYTGHAPETIVNPGGAFIDTKATAQWRIDRSNLTIRSARLPLRIRMIVSEGVHNPLNMCPTGTVTLLPVHKTGTFSPSTQPCLATFYPRRVCCVHGHARIGPHRYRSNTEDSEATRVYVPSDRGACCSSPLPTKHSWISRFRCHRSPLLEHLNNVNVESSFFHLEFEKNRRMDWKLIIIVVE